MKKLLAISLVVIFHYASFAQYINREDEQFLNRKEDTLKMCSNSIVMDERAENRFRADSMFTKYFVRALKTPFSFSYSFDSLKTISKLYAPDSSFRIFTWQLVINENLTRQHGAIQMKTYDGSLKLFPLIDKSDITKNIIDTIGNNKGWIGAVYYKIIQNRSSNQNYYTLLGYDENNIRSNRKIVEVLRFTNDEPTFGGGYFSFEEDSIKKPTQSRYVMEYKKTAGARLTYDEDLKMIIAEHLESETGEPKKKWTYIPDGDYEGFAWKNGKWIHVEKVFKQVTAEGKEPMPAPVKDAEGNTMEEKLKDNFPNEKMTEEEKKSTNTKQPAIKKGSNKKN